MRDKMKKLWAVSDLHGNLDGIDRDDVLNPAGFDFAVIAGDIAPLSVAMNPNEQRIWWNDEFVPWACQYPNVHFVMTPGNHDILLQDDPECVKSMLPGNCRILIDEGAMIDGISFYGTPWVPTINGRWAFEARKEVLAERFSLIPTGLDVLITHTPPFVRGCDCDVSLQLGWSTKYGSVELAKEIREKLPRHCFFGHVHSGSHMTFQAWGAFCRNVSRLDERYRVAYDPAAIFFEKE